MLLTVGSYPLSRANLSFLCLSSMQLTQPPPESAGQRRGADSDSPEGQDSLDGVWVHTMTSA